MQTKTSAKTKWMTGAALLALAALLAWAFAPQPQRVELARAATGRFEAGIEEDGKTRVLDRYTVSAPLAGRWLRPGLREGDRVAAGAVIGVLEPAMAPMLDARSRAELSARAEAAAAAEKRAASRVALAEVGVAQARQALQRSERLAGEGFVAAAKLDTDRLALQAAEQERGAAQAEALLARHERAQARAALGLYEQGQARAFELRAPVAAQVLRVHQNSETMVSLGTPLLELADTGRLEVVADLLTTDAMRLRPGQPVRVERWGGAGALQGQVARIEPGAFTKVSALGVEEQRVRVLVTLTGPADQLPALGDGFRVTVRVITRSEPKALMVPVSAVFPLPAEASDGLSEKHAVFRFDNGRARLTEVELEARNNSMAWLRKGLQDGEQVIVYPPPGVLDGARVRERARN